MLTKHQIETNELIRSYINRIKNLADDIQRDYSYSNPLMDVTLSKQEYNERKDIEHHLYQIMISLNNLYDKYDAFKD